MKQGEHYPPGKRDENARAAYRIFLRRRVRARALEEIEDRFDVSQPTARNLLDRGRTLAEGLNP